MSCFRNSFEGCFDSEWAGELSRRFFAKAHCLCPMEVERLSGKFAQVRELYNDLDDSKHKRTKNIQNQGMASFILMDNIPQLE